MIEQLRARYRESELLRVFEVPRSSINYRGSGQGGSTLNGNGCRSWPVRCIPPAGVRPVLGPSPGR